MKRRFQRTCQYISLFNLGMVIAAAGGYENGHFSLLGYIGLSILFFSLMILFAYLGDMFYKAK